MIGLCRGLAIRAYTEMRSEDERTWKHWVNRHECFGLIPSRSRVSRSVTNPDQAFRVSFRYFDLLDACPLRMEHSSAPAGDSK